jgi:D-sedoheptulose 7-phosphate isomerase
VGFVKHADSRKDMTLASRISQFASVVAAAEITDGNGRSLEIEETMTRTLSTLADLKQRGGAVYFVGNGGSAAVAGHAVTDFLNVGKFRAFALHEASLVTCLANDYGYENSFARSVAVLAKPTDMLVAISSSGRSENIRNAAKAMRDLGGTVLTLSGFSPDNPLRSLGDCNIWLNSSDYGMVEVGHQFVLHNITDRLLT